MRREKTPQEPRTRRRKRGSRGENGLSVSDYPLSSRHTLKISSFPGHAPGKDTLRAANAATKEGFTGRKRVKRSDYPLSSPSQIIAVYHQRHGSVVERGNVHMSRKSAADDREIRREFLLEQLKILVCAVTRTAVGEIRSV